MRRRSSSPLSARWAPRPPSRRRRGERLDPLAQSDREQELGEALAQRGLPDAFEIASALTEARLGREWVDRVAAGVGDDRLAAGLRFLAACAGTRVVLAELEEATTRIASLVGAVRSYSYLDQAPRQTVDIHEGLESTLSLLGHKLRAKQVEIVRDLDPGLPGVEASGSELNQVWTNLIDNAADAVGADGRITLRTRRQGERVCVEIADNGPGIPADLQPRVFDAFFTTKPVDQGTGLGLDIAQRIVVRHHGELRLRVRAGGHPLPGAAAHTLSRAWLDRAAVRADVDPGDVHRRGGARPRRARRPRGRRDPVRGTPWHARHIAERYGLLPHHLGRRGAGRPPWSRSAPACTWRRTNCAARLGRATLRAGGQP